MTDTIEPFDLAFGRDIFLLAFAASFTERPALSFLDWHDFMTTLPDGTPIQLMRARFFKAEFDYMMGKYLAAVPDGRFKFNLGGLDNSMPDTLTTWELRKLSNHLVYALRTDYYVDEGHGRTILDSTKAEARIQSILSVNSEE